MFAQIMIFVTGASGLLGSHLIQDLLKRQRPVRALYRSAIPVFPGADRVEWVQGDILDVVSLAEAVNGAKQVYHCAAVVSFHPGQADELYKVNVEGTANVVNACLDCGVGKLLHVSSVAALGKEKGSSVITEASQWTEAISRSVYGKTKYLSEMEVWRGVGEGLDAVVINPTIILGAGEWESGSSRIFRTVYNEFPWYTNGITGFVDVQDVAKAAIMLMESEITAERFIVNADNIAYKDLFDMIAGCFHKRKPFRNVTPFMAGLIWRVEKLRKLVTGSNPLVTKETASTAQQKLYYDNQKLLRAFPGFRYQVMTQTIARLCREYKLKYKLI